MSDTAIVITVAYSVTVVIGAVISYAVFASTRGRAVGESDSGAHVRRETAWLVIMVVALFALLLATIFYVPYGESAGANKQIVRIVGVQYAWAVDPADVAAGTPVEFRLESRGTNGEPAVNHGVGVYDPDGTLLFQAQVIPGRVQIVVHTFTEPGKYEILCLEYCGAKHHEMVTTFEVRPR
ncbi:MAG: hypothetical protein OEW31_12380 [Thermoleophilia bacterium]|nr:hypothetical protein [Thermoleophilia bacterium]